MNLGPAEILVVLVVALMVFGPKKLPEVVRQVGSAMRELRKMQDAVKSELDGVLHPDLQPRVDNEPPALEEPDHTAPPVSDATSESVPPSASDEPFSGPPGSFS
jgi:sec-independent protein translocase protein TatA